MPRGSRKRQSLLDPGDKITISIGMTVQVGERNFVKLDCAAETKIRPDEGVDQAQDRLFEALEVTLNDKIDEYVAAMNR